MGQHIDHALTFYQTLTLGSGFGRFKLERLQGFVADSAAVKHLNNQNRKQEYAHPTTIQPPIS